MPVGRPIPIETRAQIVAAYKAGEPCPAIAERFDVATSTVNMIAKKAGLTGARIQQRQYGSPDALTEAMGEWVYRDGIARFVKREKAGAR